MSKLAKALTAAAGNAGGDNLYVEDVFSTYLYEGNAGTQTITNGIDLAGEGGLVWTKNRDSASWDNGLTDTERGLGKTLMSNLTAQETLASDIYAFNSDGFDLGYATGFGNAIGSNASWTFRKAEKFFDVVTYTGDGTNGRSITHNLGVTPAFMVVKKTSATAEWAIWHQSVNGGDSYGLFTTAAFNTTAA